MITRNLSPRRSGSIAHVQPGARLDEGVSRCSGAALCAALVATSVFALVGCGQDDEPSVQTDTDGLQPRRTGSPPDPALQQDDDPPSMMDDEDEPPAINGGPLPNGLELPDGYETWSVIGVVNPEPETGNDTIRVIVGNRTAVEAARSGQTNPWPDGTMLMHYQWLDADKDFPAGSTANGDFAALTLMVKNSTAYADDFGWAYGVWAGPDLTPAPAADFDRACVNCHVSNVADNDYVFTRPGSLPDITAVNNAEEVPSGLALPGDILGWGVIGAISRPNDMANGVPNPNIRVIVGNDIAVAAAREGMDGEWPEGAMLAHYVWGAANNSDVPGAVAPGEFQMITLMEKQGEDYEVDGLWKYGVWTSSQLARVTDPGFDRQCVQCHLSNAQDSDYVFTIPGAVPGDL